MRKPIQPYKEHFLVPRAKITVVEEPELVIEDNEAEFERIRKQAYDEEMRRLRAEVKVVEVKQLRAVK